MIYIEELTEKISPDIQTELGRRLLRKGLEFEYGISELPEIYLGEFGKPFFKSYPEIFFNISHCEKGVVCGISNRPIGIDIESIKPFDKDLAEYISTNSEFIRILKSPDPAIAFTVLWTEKESYCKLTGKGLNTRKEIQDSLINNNSLFLTTINEAGGYVLTICQ